MFDPAKEQWDMYHIRFEAARRVAQVTENVDELNLLVMSLIPEVFRHLYDLLQSRDILSAVYFNLSNTTLPRSLKNVRDRSFLTRQGESESVEDFVERLSAIVPHCEAETNVRVCSLLTVFIVRLYDSQICACLVLENDLTLETATTMRL